jgi:hypothetical protein
MPTNFNNLTKVVNPAKGPVQPRDNRINTKYTDNPTVRNIAPLTTYNTETGTVDTDPNSPWGGDSPAETVEEVAAVKPKVEVPKTQEVDRYAAWKLAEDAKKVEREQGRQDKATKQQALAKDFLMKGDLVNAAKALNMSPAELALYVDNARLGIPNKQATPAKLTLEQQIEKLNKELQDSKQEAAKYNQTLEVSNWIKDNIVPELSANKDKYEVLHMYEPKDVQAQIYQLMNEHFQETKETLKVSEVAEMLEDQLANIHRSSVEKLKAAKKFQDLFVPEAKVKAKKPAATLAETDVEEEQEGGRNLDRSVTRNISLESEDYQANKTKSDSVTNKLINRNKKLNQDLDEAEAEADELTEQLNPTAAVKRSTSTKKVPYAFLSKEERMARLNEDD